MARPDCLCRVNDFQVVFAEGSEGVVCSHDFEEGTAGDGITPIEPCAPCDSSYHVLEFLLAKEDSTQPAGTHTVQARYGNGFSESSGFTLSYGDTFTLGSASKEIYLGMVELSVDGVVHWTLNADCVGNSHPLFRGQRYGDFQLTNGFSQNEQSGNRMCAANDQGGTVAFGWLTGWR